ncbi:hypothetical protein AMTR_s00023p00241180 [Amborella trichopoda]|uniref:Aminotransferase-like plant mobile domain-containing protein n=1 Tax=Amborella trichopoda TaxID=13333 RepID=W1NKN0_AMBTC|nr:hypothetical protein AMTR_s00023p00241180 [Amborella trichopoda]
MPRASEWNKQPCKKDPLTAFDDISIDMVTWQPYEEYNPRDTLSKENALCRSYLICFNIVEFYMSDRVLRQFGMMQAIPVGPPKWDRRENVGVHPTSWIEATDVNEKATLSGQTWINMVECLQMNI